MLVSRLYRRRDRIKDEVPITQVLSFYGYRVTPDSYEQQFPCDLHGDGQDNKPSARVYPQSNDWYCFACDQTRDAISTVEEKEGISFAEAIRVLEQRHNLPDLPWEDGDEYQRTKPLAEQLDEGFEQQGYRSFDDERKRVERLLQGITQEHDLPMGTVLASWEAFDRICYEVAQENWNEDLGKQALEKLRTRVMNKLIQ